MAIGGGGTLTNATVVDGTVVAGTDHLAPGRPRGGLSTRSTAQALRRDASRAMSTSTGRPERRPGCVHFKVGYTKANGDTDRPALLRRRRARRASPIDLSGGSPQVSFTGVDPTRPADLHLRLRVAATRSPTTTTRNTPTSIIEQSVELGPINALKVGVKYTDHDRVATLPRAPPSAASSCRSRPAAAAAPCTSPISRRRLTPDDFLDDIALPGTLTELLAGRPQRSCESIFNSQPAANRDAHHQPAGELTRSTRRSYGGYVMAKFGGDDWSGNIGVRVDPHRPDLARQQSACPAPDADQNPFGNFTPIDGRALLYRHPAERELAASTSRDELVLRLAAGRTMARPELIPTSCRASISTPAR